MKSKKKIALILPLLFIGSWSTVTAQEPVRAANTQERKVFSIEELATKETEKLKEEVDLTEDQYKKVFSMYVKEYKAIFHEMELARTPKYSMVNHGIRVPRGMSNNGLMGEQAFVDDDEPKIKQREAAPIDFSKAHKKRQVAREKMLIKILTIEQYSKYHELHPFKF